MKRILVFLLAIWFPIQGYGTQQRELNYETCPSIGPNKLFRQIAKVINDDEGNIYVLDGKKKYYDSRIIEDRTRGR